MRSANKTLYEALIPLLTLSQALGLSFYCENPRRPKTKYKKIIDKIGTPVAIVSIIVIFINGLPLCFDNFSTVVSGIATRTQRFNNIVLITTNVTFALMRRRRISGIVNNLVLCGSELEGVSGRLSYESVCKRANITLMSEMSLIGVVVILEVLLCVFSGRNYMCAMTQIVTYMNDSVVHCQITIFLRELKERFRAVNLILARLLPGLYLLMKRQEKLHVDSAS